MRLEGWHVGLCDARVVVMTPANTLSWLLARRERLHTRYREEIDRADEQQTLQESEMVEHATEQWDAHLLSMLGDLDRRALADTRTALDRLARGLYGLCSRCGVEIEVLRLAALPTATSCIQCARAADRD